MPRVVDGDNLLGSWPGRDRSDEERLLLAREISRLALRERREILVVFDGSAPPGVRSGPGVAFAGPGREADDLIVARVRSETDRRGLTVVTNDRALADRCRNLGARVERCDVFRERLLAGVAPEKPSESEEIEYWKKVFRDP